jgi:hypothetical protein
LREAFFHLYVSGTAARLVPFLLSIAFAKQHSHTGKGFHAEAAFPEMANDLGVSYFTWFSE